MEKVVTINLNGNPYQLDESAFDAVRAYLERARQALADNPDKAEIIADLEQAIADRASGYLGPGKTVISQVDMARILTEMGPVDGGHDEDASEAPSAAPRADGAESASASSEPRPRKLYRLPQGAIIAGVCNGLGAYMQVDVSLVRLGFILIAFVGHSWGVFGLVPAIIVYGALAFLIPTAHTPEEWASAHGAPFNAQEIIDQAKRDYSEFARTGDWRWSRRAWRAARRGQRRAYRRAARYGMAPGPMAYAPMAPAVRVGVATGIVAGVIALVTTLVRIGLAIGFFVIVISLLATGSVFGTAPPAHIPVWGAVLLTLIAFLIISGPFRAMNRLAYGALNGRTYYRSYGADLMVGPAIMLLVGWLFYTSVPGFHAWVDQWEVWAEHVWTAFIASLPKQ